VLLLPSGRNFLLNEHPICSLSLAGVARHGVAIIEMWVVVSIDLERTA